MEEWIVVPNWERFQHYADRDPAWIKAYTELQNRDDWLHLTLAERGLLVCIWLEYARRRGQLRTSDIPSFVLQKVPRRSLDSLREAGFINFLASKPLAQSKRESKTPHSPPKNGKPKDLKKRVTGCRLVRGSHGVSFIADPEGVDPPPRDWPRVH